MTGSRTAQGLPYPRSTGLLGAGLALVALGLVLVVATSGDLAAQDPQGWNPGITVVPSPPDDAWATQAPTEPDQPATESNAVERAREALAASEAGPGVELNARLTEDGRRLIRDLTWRVYKEPEEDGGVPQLLETRTSPMPRIALQPGNYFINLAFGRSHITRRITVKDGPMASETFILNAGGLRLTAYAGEKQVPDKTVSFDVFEAETDQSGQRRLILSKARPGVILRLNAGIYYIRSTYGEANAQVESEVSVEAGKLTEIAMAHAAAKVTLALVTRAGGEALPATQWEIATPDGDVIDRSVGALPTHVIAPGTYRVTATNGGKVFSKDVNLEDNQTARIEILAQ